MFVGREDRPRILENLISLHGAVNVKTMKLVSIPQKSLIPVHNALDNYKVSDGLWEGYHDANMSLPTHDDVDRVWVEYTFPNFLHFANSLRSEDFFLQDLLFVHSQMMNKNQHKGDFPIKEEHKEFLPAGNFAMAQLEDALRLNFPNDEDYDKVTRTIMTGAANKEVGARW